MSLNLDLCVWTVKPMRPELLLLRVCQFCSKGDLKAKEWANLRCFENSTSDYDRLTSGEISLDKLGKLIDCLDMQEANSHNKSFSIAAATSILLDSSTSDMHLSSPLTMRVKTYGQSFDASIGRRSEMQPDLLIRIEDFPSRSLSPFSIPSGSDPQVQEKIRNAHRLYVLLQAIVDLLGPLTVKVFCYSELYFPFNSCCIYYKTNQALIQDCRFLADLVDNGLPTYNIPPCKKWDIAEIYTYLHECRTDDGRRKIWEWLVTASARFHNVDTYAVDTFLSKGFVSIEADRSFLFATKSPPIGGFGSDLLLDFITS